MSIKGIQNIGRLMQLIVQRSYSKNDDIIILEQNEYSKECAESYMDGYIDGLSYVLSMIEPDIDFEGYINKMIENEITDISVIKPGVILASKKVPDILNNLSLVLSCSKTSEGIIITTTPIIYDIGNYRWERKYDITIENLPTIYHSNLAIDLGTMYPFKMNQKDIDNIKNTFSVIHIIEENKVNDIINAFEAYDKEMGALYDAAIKNNT